MLTCFKPMWSLGCFIVLCFFICYPAIMLRHPFNPGAAICTYSRGNDMDNSRILIIDDDPNLRKTLSDILRVKGCKTLTARKGAEGLALLETEAVDVVLIDLD